jgi:glycosyltransferase involved in cell wall biosynthesis
MAEFVIIGRAPNEDVVWMKKFIEDNQIQANIGFTGWINFKQIPQFLENANIGILLLQPVSLNNFMGLPNKLFDYMAAGIPTVACHFPNISKIVNETNCGILVDPTDVEAIARAIIYLIENPDEAEIMGHNGRNAFERKYNWEMMERRLLDIYSKLLKAG